MSKMLRKKYYDEIFTANFIESVNLKMLNLWKTCRFLKNMLIVDLFHAEMILNEFGLL